MRDRQGFPLLPFLTTIPSSQTPDARACQPADDPRRLSALQAPRGGYE